MQTATWCTWYYAIFVSNAIKFTPVQGNITVEASENGKMTTIFIRDSGVGISEENLEKLFHEYYTSKGTADENGTGLGLMLCKEFLTKNGGKLKVTSRRGKEQYSPLLYQKLRNSNVTYFRA